MTGELEEAGDGTSSQDVESEASSGGEREEVLSVVSRVISQSEARTDNTDQSQVSGMSGVRPGQKISLPAKMSDLYQSYPGDTEGMVRVQGLAVPQIVFTRPSITSTQGPGTGESGECK